MSNLPSPPLAPGSTAHHAAQFGGGNTCTLAISGTTALGPNTGQSFDGAVSMSLSSDGIIDSGSFQLADGTSLPVNGQAIGRSIRLRIGTDATDAVILTGCGFAPIVQCSGELSGSFSGPGLDNLGVWSASARLGD